MRCPAEKPIKCINNECKTYPHECMQENITNSSSSNIRLLAESTSQSCGDSTPHRCYDGSCRADVNNCP